MADLWLAPDHPRQHPPAGRQEFRPELHGGKRWDSCELGRQILVRSIPMLTDEDLFILRTELELAATELDAELLRLQDSGDPDPNGLRHRIGMKLRIALIFRKCLSIEAGRRQKQNIGPKLERLWRDQFRQLVAQEIGGTRAQQLFDRARSLASKQLSSPDLSAS